MSSRYEACHIYEIYRYESCSLFAVPHNPNSKCVHAHGFRTCATPTFGSIVVKGKFPVATLVCVAAEKNVDLPTFALPSNPICIVYESVAWSC